MPNMPNTTLSTLPNMVPNPVPISPHLIQLSESSPFQPTQNMMNDPVVGRNSVFSPLAQPQQTFRYPSGNRFQDMSCDELAEWAKNIQGITKQGREKIAVFIVKENLSGFVLAQMRGNIEIIRFNWKL